MDTASASQLRKFLESVVVDKGVGVGVGSACSDEPKAAHTVIGDCLVCGVGDLCLCGSATYVCHEKPMSVSSIALNVHPSDTSAAATATTTAATTNNKDDTQHRQHIDETLMLLISPTFPKM